MLAAVSAGSTPTAYLRAGASDPGHQQKPTGAAPDAAREGAGRRSGCPGTDVRAE
jgi:hypothetical protein